MHWTQTPEGKKRMGEIRKLAHKKTREAKIIQTVNARRTYNKKQGGTVLVINGWRITLSKGEIRIDN